MAAAASAAAAGAPASAAASSAPAASPVVDGGVADAPRRPRRAATSDTAPTTAASSASARSETIQASISRAGEGRRRRRASGVQASVSPSSPSADEHHVGAHGGHLDVVGQRRADLHDAAAVGHLGEVDGRLGGLGSALRPRSASRSRTRPLQALDQRLGVDLLLAARLDRVDGGGRARRGTRAGRRSPRAARPPLALAQQLEDVLHLVRERRHAGEAHRRAHALQRVRDAEDLVDRLAGRRGAPRSGRRRG